MSIRYILAALLASVFLNPIAACDSRSDISGNNMNSRITLNVVLYSYLDKPIFDTFLNSEYAGGRAEFPYGAKGTIAGVVIPLGPQTLTWRDAGSGEKFAAKGSLTLTAENIPTDARYLGVHIYPDGSAELIASRHFPDLSTRGKTIEEEYKKNGK